MGAVKRVTLVCGPPGSGKSRYVRERAQHGDLIWDHDLVTNALSGNKLEKYDKPAALLQFVMAARAGVLKQLESSPGNVRHAWIILTEPNAARRKALAARLSAEVVVLAVDPNACMRNILNDPDRGLRKMQLSESLILKWWKDYTAELAWM